MPASMACPHCRHVLTFNPTDTGKTTRCPECAKPIKLEGRTHASGASLQAWSIVSFILFVCTAIGFGSAFQILQRADNSIHQLAGILCAIGGVVSLTGMSVVELLRTIASRTTPP